MNQGGEPIELAVPAYPTLQWVARHGAALPFVAGGLILGGGVLLTLRDHSPWWSLLGVVGAGVAVMLSRLLVEIVRLLVETLIPQ